MHPRRSADECSAEHSGSTLFLVTLFLKPAPRIAAPESPALRQPIRRFSSVAVSLMRVPRNSIISEHHMGSRTGNAISKRSVTEARASSSSPCQAAARHRAEQHVLLVRFGVSSAPQNVHRMDSTYVDCSAWNTAKRPTGTDSRGCLRGVRARSRHRCVGCYHKRRSGGSLLPCEENQSGGGPASFVNGSSAAPVLARGAGGKCCSSTPPSRTIRRA